MNSWFNVHAGSQRSEYQSPINPLQLNNKFNELTDRTLSLQPSVLNKKNLIESGLFNPEVDHIHDLQKIGYIGSHPGPEIQRRTEVGKKRIFLYDLDIPVPAFDVF